MISFDEFKRLDIRAATVLSAERVEGSEKLVKLSLDAGERDPAGAVAPRQILAGIVASYLPETLVGRQVVIAANLEPRRLMGFESNGMLLAAHGADSDGAVGAGGPPVLLVPERPVPPGSAIS